jgi:hypothetical protein
MKRFWLGVAAATMVSACGGGNPWLKDGGDPTDPTIPTEQAGDLDSVVYDPTAQTLTVNGMTFDGGPQTTVYTRNAALDRVGYEAYTTQNSSLDRHYTAFVKQMDGATASIVVAGAQFGYYFGGSTYSRSGAYSAPANGQVTYIGNYVGLTNAPRSPATDLLAPPAGTDPLNTPSQSAEVTGRVALTANFNNSSIEGSVTNRVVVDSGTSIDDLEFQNGVIASDGTFAGKATQGVTSVVGDYGGIFGGTGATSVAGTLYVKDHITGATSPEEYGLFVIAQCGSANADPACP